MRRRYFLMTMIGAGMTANAAAQAHAQPAPVRHNPIQHLDPVQPPAAGDQRAKAKLRFCSQLGIIPGNRDEEKLQWMKANGFEAVELGRLGKDGVEWKKKAGDAGLDIAALCIGSFGNKLVDEDETKRKQGYDELKVQLERAGAVGAAGVVYVPLTNNPNPPDLPFQHIRQRTVDMLQELGPFAAAHNTHIILEPLRRSEAWFLRQISDAAQIARDADVPGVAVLGDTYHMFTEEPDDMAAFIAGGNYLKHVHLGNGINRQLPGQEDHSFVKAMRGLKYIGYNRFVSFECGVRGDAAVMIPPCLDYLRQCWEEA